VALRRSAGFRACIDDEWIGGRADASVQSSEDFIDRPAIDETRCVDKPSAG